MSKEGSEHVVITTRISNGSPQPDGGLTCFCAAIRFWSLFLQAGSCRCWKVSYPVVIPEGRRTWKESKASVKLPENLPCLLLERGAQKGCLPQVLTWAATARGQMGRQGEGQFQPRRSWSTPYLETSSFDTPIKLIVLPSPAPEAVGHAIALK